MPHPIDTDLVRVLELGSDAALRRRFMLIDEAVRGNIRFGPLLEVLDKLAEECALAHARRTHADARVVTAAIDTIYIRNPADVGRDMVFRARINFVGRTSMEVGIRVEHPETEREPGAHIASCYFTMVARDAAAEGAKSLPVPALDLEDALDRRRAERAVARREAYKQGLQLAQEPPSREEYRRLSDLHAAQEASGFDGLLASQCVTESWDRTYPEHENVPQKIFGGHLIRRAYEQASICAEAVAPDRPVIKSVNRINFFQPVRMGDKLHFLSRVTYTGRSSLSVETDIIRISRDRAQTHLSNTCVFTFVNVDDELRVRPVPQVHPTTYAEDARYLSAHRRHREHLAFKEADRKE